LCRWFRLILAHRWDHWQIGLVAVPVKWYAIAAIYFAALVSTDFGGRLLHRLLEEDRPRLKGSPQGRRAFARQEREIT
jgi:hypothetical protein